MENASKALLMAGGILIALLVIGALVLMFNQVGSYEKAQEASKKNSQIADFNKDFERYLDDKGITGADVISLINKVLDYNEKTVKAESGVDIGKDVDYSIKMSVTITNINSFNDKYAYTDDSEKIFTSNTIYIGEEKSSSTDKDKGLMKILTDEQKLETNSGISKDQLKMLSGMYDSKDKGSTEKIKDKLIELTNDTNYRDWPDNNKKPTLTQIKNYRQYWEFKTSKFEPDENVGGARLYAKNGQIKNLRLKFKE